MVSKKRLKETLQYIKDNEVFNEENIAYLEENFNGSRKEVEAFIIDHPRSLCRTPLLKDYIKRVEFQQAVVEWFFDDRITFVLEQILDHISVSDLLKIPGFREGFLESDYQVIKSVIPLDTLDDELKGHAIKCLLDNITVSNFLTLPEAQKHVVINDQNLAKKLILSLVRSYDDDYLEDYEKDLYEKNKEVYFDLSLSNKVSIIKHTKDESLKKEMVDDFDLVQNIRNLSNDQIEVIFDLLDRDFWVDYAIKLTNAYDLSKMLHFFTKEEQIRIFTSPDCKLANSLLDGNILLELHEDLQYNLFANYYNSFTLSKTWGLYQKNGRSEYLTKIKEIINSGQPISVYDSFIFTKEFTSILEPNEKQLLIEHITPPTAFYVWDQVLMTINSNIKEGLDEDVAQNLLSQFIELIKTNNPYPDHCGRISPQTFYRFFNTEEQTLLFGLLNPKELLERAFTSEEQYKMLMDLLKINPTIFQNMDLSDVKLSTYSILMLDNYEEKMINLLSYFKEEQYSLFFDLTFLEQNENIKKIFKEQALSNPNIINSIYMFEFFTEAEIHYILSSMDVLHLCNISIGYGEDDKLIKNMINKRIEEVIHLINTTNDIASYRLSWIYDCLTEENKTLLIHSLAKDFYEIYDALHKKLSPENNEYLMDRMIEELSNNNEKTFWSLSLFMSNLSGKEYRQFLKKLDIVSCMKIIQKFTNGDMQKRLMDIIRKDYRSLLNDNIVQDLDITILGLSKEYQDEINSILTTELQKRPLYNQLAAKLKNVTPLTQVTIIKLIDRGYLNEEKIATIEQLLNTNPFLFSSLDVNMFRDDIYELGFSSLKKICKYPELEKKIVGIFNENPVYGNFIIRAVRYLEQTGNLPEINDQILEEIINRISSKKINNIETVITSNLTDEELVNIIDYLLQTKPVTQKSEFEIYQVEAQEGFGIKTYNEEKNARCDELMQMNNFPSIDSYKHIYFRKYFSRSLDDILIIYKAYIKNYDSVKEYASSDIPLKFIDIVNKILSIDDVQTMRQIYNSTTEYYKASDIMTIISIMKDAYNKEIAQSIKGKQEGTNVTKVYKDADGNDVALNMTELVDNFGILVHSTCAYGSMQLIDDNYFVSWNYNPRTSNHGICCSYITNSSYGTANVTGAGVMFGFTNLNEHSVATYSPYDLVTYNDNFTISSHRNPYCTKLDDVPRTTRHTHNEFDLERRNDTIESKYPSIQPDCIIIFEDMPDEIKANSIKAYQDFKEQGIELKLIYMDRKKIAINEANKVKNMVNQFEVNHELSILREIINTYESNICGMDFMKDVNKDELFMTDTISNILHSIPEYLASMQDINERNEQIVEFIDILESEQYKFDLVQEQIGNRGHRFLLYDDELKQQVEGLRQLLNQTYTANKEMV